ncbi:MAG: outer membrane protein assembly factor BamD [Schleiferiaceae bacterium]|nr:outer membrane protein assembly factor BamD [Schleiferiaceae bacterium]
MRKIALIATAISLLASCGEYQKVLKSTDPAFKFIKAVEYYDAEQYNKAYPLFDELMSAYRGTTRAQDVYKYYAQTLYGQKDFILAGYHFKRFSQTFPKNDFAEEASYRAAYCFYLEAPVSSLDPAYTFKAMDEMQLFINTHEGSPYIPEANGFIDELRERLEKKAFDIAKGYHHRQLFSSAVTSLNVMLSEFPDSPYREEALMLRLESAFKLAENSVKDKEAQRFKEAETAYLEFMDAYPETTFLNQANSCYSKIQAFLQKES